VAVCIIWVEPVMVPETEPVVPVGWSLGCPSVLEPARVVVPLYA